MQQTRFLDDCIGLRMAMERQRQRMQAAQSTQQSACGAGPSQECSDATATWQSEERLLRTLETRYRQCQLRSTTAYPFGGYGFYGYGSGLMFDPLNFELNYASDSYPDWHF